MIQEFMRLSHIRTEERIKDLNLTIFAGEILYLLSNHRGELEEVWQMIVGSRKVTQGFLTLNEQRKAGLYEAAAKHHGIFHINSERQLVQSLTIAENIFVIRQWEGLDIFQTYDSKVLFAKAETVLTKVGLQQKPDTKVYRLSAFECFQVCLAKALVNNAKLLLIDDAENQFNLAELRAIEKLLCCFREEGIASLILADRPGELLSIANKIIILKDGRDVKTYFSQDKRHFSQTEWYQMVADTWLGAVRKPLPPSGVSTEPEPTQGQSLVLTGELLHLELKPGCIYGFYDMFRDQRNEFRHDLDRFELVNQCSFKATEADSTQGILDLINRKRAIYVPRKSASLLLENFGIGRNISIANQGKAGRFLGLTSKRIDCYLEAEFCRQFDLDPGTTVPELNCMQRKAISIYRWLLWNPRMLILEDPTYQLNHQEADSLRAYIKELAKTGLTVLLCENSLYEEQLICDTIIYTEKSRYCRKI